MKIWFSSLLLLGASRAAAQPAARPPVAATTRLAARPQPAPGNRVAVAAPADTVAAPAGLTAQLRGFLRDVTQQKLSSLELVEKYFCTTMTRRSDKYGEQARRGLDWALTTQRRLLREQQVDAEAVRLVPFAALSASELPPKPFHMLCETKHVYVAQYQGQIVSYFLVQDGKIASTLLIGQGIEHYFIDFCR